MPFPPPPVTTLVVPTGATSGVRIVIDGVTGTITGYAADNSVTWQLAGGSGIAAGSAVNATNLTGGGSAAGSTTIAGELVVGNPAASHVVVGSDGFGADGVRLYANDGITPLVDLNVSAGSGVITAATVRTAAAGHRWEIRGTASDTIFGFTGDPDENASAQLTTDINGAGGPRTADLFLFSPSLGVQGGATLLLRSTSFDGTTGGYAELAGRNAFAQVGTSDVTGLAGLTVNNVINSIDGPSPGDLRINGVTMPRGTVNEFTYATTGTQSLTSTEVMISEAGNLGFAFISGRRYKVTVVFYVTVGTTGNLVAIRLRHTGSSAAPTTSSAIIGLDNVTGHATQAAKCLLVYEFKAASSAQDQFGASAYMLTGTAGTVQYGSVTPTQFLIEDITGAA